MEDNLLRTSLDPRHLELTLMPTEQCNFRCTYCYEDFSIGQMAPNVQEALKRFLERRIPSLKHLDFQWFGGEPLAARQLVYGLSAFAQRLCETHGVQFTGSLTTNGYQLSPDVLERLYELNMRGYQISLDGWGAGHDETRRLASGGGTFERIWSNLLAIKKSSLAVTVLLRVHLTPKNVESVKSLALELRREFLIDPRFQILLKPIENLGGPLRGSILTLTKAERSAALAEVKSLLGLIAPAPGPDAPVLRTSICYASRPNAFVIRADGRVQKCTVALSEDHNTVGKLMKDGSIELDRQKMAPWMRGYVNGEPDELRCPAQSFPRSHQRAVIPIEVVS